MVEDATQLNAAQNFDLLTVESVCETMPTLCASVYILLPIKLFFDDCSQFRDTFVEICEIHDLEWKRLGVQHKDALGTESKIP